MRKALTAARVTPNNMSTAPCRHTTAHSAQALVYTCMCAEPCFMHLHPHSLHSYTHAMEMAACLRRTNHTAGIFVCCTHVHGTKQQSGRQREGLCWEEGNHFTDHHYQQKHHGPPRPQALHSSLDADDGREQRCGWRQN
jgi:hypothetical protein